jgi:hypothetical protein
VPPEIVDAVAHEFELHEIEPVPPSQLYRGDDQQLRQALQGMATLMDRLRRPQ